MRTHPAAPAAPPALLEVAARLPIAASLIVQALGAADRKALRAAHPLLLTATAREVTKLEADVGYGEDAALSPLRWPALRELTLKGSVDALWPSGAQVWERLEVLVVEDELIECCYAEQEKDSSEEEHDKKDRVDALAAAAPRMPKLRVLRIENCWEDSTRVVAALFRTTRWPSLEELELSVHGSDAYPVGPRKTFMARSWPARSRRPAGGSRGS
jgi:hypothetical protein